MFYRDSAGNEVDGILEEGIHTIPIEIKAGQTIRDEFFRGLKHWYSLANKDKGYVIYGGLENQERTLAQIISWQSIDTIFKQVTEL